MKNINLKKIVEDRDIDIQQLAKDLFPSHTHPKKALIRILDNKAQLDSLQIVKLSVLLDVPIQDLFETGSWKMRSQKGLILLTSGNFRAELDMVTLSTKVFQLDSLKHEEIISKNSITLSEYINNLNTIIKSF